MSCCLSSQSTTERNIAYLTEYGCSRSDEGNCFAVETTGALDAVKNVCNIIQLYS